MGAKIISEAFVHRVEWDGGRKRVAGVSYIDSVGNEQHVRAGMVILSAHALETPRILLLSGGLANSSGLVGKGLMSHPTWQVFGKFDEPINAYKGMQMGHVMVQGYYRPDPGRGWNRAHV